MQNSQQKTFSPRKLLGLQSLRLFASLGVFQYHLWNNYLGVPLGLPSTDFFFVIVGGVAALSQARRISEGGWGKYIWARYVRLYITFIPLFLIALAWKWQPGAFEWAVQSFFLIPMADQNPVIGATWMLSQFLLFYFVFSLTFLSRTERILWPVFVLWIVGIVGFNWFHWNPGIPNHWMNTLFYERNMEFIFGYVVGIFLRKDILNKTWGRRLFWLGLLGVVGAVFLLNTQSSTLGRSLYTGIPAALMIWGISAMEVREDTSRVVRFFTWPWFVLAGSASYVLYIGHGIFLQAWDRLLPMSPLLIPIMTLVLIFFSIIGYEYWEKPMLTLIRKREWTFPRLESFPRLLKNALADPEA